VGLPSDATKSTERQARGSSDLAVASGAAKLNHHFHPVVVLSSAGAPFHAVSAHARTTGSAHDVPSFPTVVMDRPQINLMSRANFI